MLEITLEHSILKKFNIDTTNMWDEQINFLKKICQHTIVVSEELMEYEELMFEKESPLDKEWYKQFIADKMHCNKNFKIIEEVKEKFSSDKLNKYQNHIVNLCLSSYDKILLTDSSKLLSIKKVPLEKISYDMIMSNKLDNTFTKYTLPINGCIEAGQGSKELGEWIGRFIKDANYIQIHDNFICSPDNIKSFNKYILKYIAEHADVDIYTIETEDISKEDLVCEFTKEQYQKWKIHVYLLKSKKEHHDRVIETEKYVIQIGRGMSGYGKGGKTFQTLINIYNSNEKQYVNYGGNPEQIV